MDYPFVSVVVPHLNDHVRLAECLALLHQQSYPAELTEIIVVDNGSAVPITEVVRPFPRVRAAVEQERGCGVARNAGVKVCKGEILAFTDSDVRPDRDWIANAVRWLTNDSGTDIVGGRIDMFCVDEAHPTDVELYEKVFAFHQQAYVTRKHYSAGANIVTTRAAFDKVGPFRDGRVAEDMEWGRRASALGLTIRYCPDVVVSHPCRRTMKDLLWKMDRTLFHKIGAMRDKPWFLARWLGLAAAYAVPPVDKLAEIVACDALTSWDQRARAAKVLFAVRYRRVGRMVGCLSDPAFGREHFPA